MRAIIVMLSALLLPAPPVVAQTSPSASKPSAPATQAAPPAPARAKPAGQSSGGYVVIWSGAKEFHGPSCPLIKGAKGVTLVTRDQAAAKGLKQHADCDPATIGSGPVPDYVYVSKDEKTYHREDCKVKPKDAARVKLDKDAVKGRWPCTVCRPPIRPSGPPAVQPR